MLGWVLSLPVQPPPCWGCNLRVPLPAGRWQVGVLLKEVLGAHSKEVTTRSDCDPFLGGEYLAQNIPGASWTGWESLPPSLPPKSCCQSWLGSRMAPGQTRDSAAWQSPPSPMVPPDHQQPLFASPAARQALRLPGTPCTAPDLLRSCPGGRRLRSRQGLWAHWAQGMASARLQPSTWE